jgi:hypothetical protein
LLAAFFACLGLALPIMFQTTQDFLSTEDDLLAKRISNTLTEQVNLMQFLGDSSQKSFEFVPLKSISIYSKSSELIIETKNKSFSVDFHSPQLILKQEFANKFIINLKKVGGNIIATLEST